MSTPVETALTPSAPLNSTHELIQETVEQVRITFKNPHVLLPKGVEYSLPYTLSNLTEGELEVVLDKYVPAPLTGALGQTIHTLQSKEEKELVFTGTLPLESTLAEYTLVLSARVKGSENVVKGRVLITVLEEVPEEVKEPEEVPEPITKKLYLISSAIGNNRVRAGQTLAYLQELKEKDPDAEVFLVELSRLDPKVKKQLNPYLTGVLDLAQTVASKLSQALSREDSHYYLVAKALLDTTFPPEITAITLVAGTTVLPAFQNETLISAPNGVEGVKWATRVYERLLNKLTEKALLNTNAPNLRRV